MDREKNENLTLSHIIDKTKFHVIWESKFERQKIMLLKDNIEKYFHDFQVGEYFLHRIQKF